jgi:hypothetical protein
VVLAVPRKREAMAPDKWISAPRIHAIFPLAGSVLGEGQAPEAYLDYDKMPGVRLVERQNDGARDFGVSLAGYCLHSQPTSHLSQK